MKPSVIKSLLLGSLVLFGVILLMTIGGCIACASGATDAFFCGVFRIVGISVLSLTAIGITGYTIKTFLQGN